MATRLSEDRTRIMWSPATAREALKFAVEDMDMKYGGSERTLESTVLPIALAAVGWNPLQGFAWSFQIPTGRFPDATRPRSSRAADLVVGEDECVRLILESKSVQVGLGDVQRAQVLGYQRAIGAPRAVLMNGRQWQFFDEKGQLCADVGVSGSDDVPTLLSALEAHVDAVACPRASWPYPNAWRIGRRVEPLPLVAEEVQALMDDARAIGAASQGRATTTVSGKGSLLLYVEPQHLAILELKKDGALAKRDDNLRKLEVSADVISAYVDAHMAKNPSEVISVCRQVLRELDR